MFNYHANRKLKLLYSFVHLKAFSNSAKVKSLYSIFFSMENGKSSNVLDVLCILLPRFYPSHLYFSNQIEFDLKSINQEFLLLLKLLKKNYIQCFTIEL